MAPSLCGTFLADKRSLVAFTWTMTTVVTLLSFLVAIGLMIHVHMYYIRMENYYEEQYEYNRRYNNANNNDDQVNGGEQHENSADREELEYYLQLSTMASSSMTFVAVYTVIMAIALSLYGSTAIVGFTSLQGVYIAPCFSSSVHPKLRVGIFGGAIIFFANLLLLCAVIFGEVRVEDWQHNGGGEGGDHDDDKREPYEVERIAAILAITFMFLSAMYTIFAVLLFLYAGGNDEECLEEDAVISIAGGRKPSLPSFAPAPPSSTTGTPDPRMESFLSVGRSK
jgi:hypothetical protein